MLLRFALLMMGSETVVAEGLVEIKTGICVLLAWT